MKQILSLLLLFTLSARGQNLELVWHKGQPPVDVLYNGDEDYVKLSALTHMPDSCPPPTQFISIAFGAHITNSGAQIAQGIQLRVDHYSFGQIVRSLISPIIDSLVPGDTTSYSMTMTDSVMSSHIWKDDFFTISIQESGQNSGVLDTVYLSIMTGSFSGVPLSTDFENYNGTFTTDSLGFDGYGYAFLLPFEGGQEIVGLSLPFGHNTIPGGDLQLQLYDSAAFDSSNGTFKGSAAFTESFTISPGFNTGPQKTNMYWLGSGLLPFSLCSKRKYWCVLTLYSNGGFNTIEFYNDTTVIQPDAACLVYTKSTSQWVPVSQGPDWLQNPSLTLLVYSRVISIPENAAASKNTMVYPNPTSGIFYLKGLGTQTAALKIYNSSGREVLYQPAVHEKQSIQLHHQPAGLYLVQVLQKDKVLYSEKLLLQP